MKLIARSEVPAKPAYLHLAYIAAKTNGLPDLFVGVAMLSITAAIAAYIIQNMSVKVKVAVAALLLGIFAVMLVFLQPFKVRYANPAPLTIIHAQLIYREALHGSRRQLHEQKDGWFHSYQLVKYHEDGHDKFKVVSAGPDGIFGNKDDLTYPQNTQEE